MLYDTAVRYPRAFEVRQLPWGTIRVVRQVKPKPVTEAENDDDKSISGDEDYDYGDPDDALEECD